MADLAIYLHAGQVQSLTQAANLALMALSDGDRALIGLFYDGLAGWTGALAPELLPAPGFGDTPWAQATARGFSALPIPALGELVATCREIGGDRLRVYACSASLEVLGLEAATLIERGVVDDVVGLPTIWRRTRGMRWLGL